MKTIKENINSKEFNKLMIYTRGREYLRQIIWDYDVVVCSKKDKKSFLYK